MTDKEYAVKARELNVRISESKLHEASVNRDQGFRRLQAEFEEKMAKLHFEVDRAKIELERDKHFLELAKSDLERGYTA